MDRQSKRSPKMSDERKGLLKWVDDKIEFNEKMQRYTKGITPNHWKKEGKTLQQIRQLVQQKPEIDEKYVDELSDVTFRAVIHFNEDLGIDNLIEVIRESVRQIVKDVRGREKSQMSDA